MAAMTVSFWQYHAAILHGFDIGTLPYFHRQAFFESIAAHGSKRDCQLGLELIESRFELREWFAVLVTREMWAAEIDP